MYNTELCILYIFQDTIKPLYNMIIGLQNTLYFTTHVTSCYNRLWNKDGLLYHILWNMHCFVLFCYGGLLGLLYIRGSHMGNGKFMMTSSNVNIFRATGHLCGEFTGHRWITHTKASDAVLWCFLWSAPEWTVKKTTVGLVIKDAIAPITTSQ